MTGVTPAWMLDETTVMSESVMKRLEAQCEYLFVYGILKRGFVLDLTHRAEFIGEAVLPGAILYSIGSGVGLRLTEDLNKHAYGEVFKIPQRLWKWLDGIESNGYNYTRKVVPVDMFEYRDAAITMMNAWVYEHTAEGMVYNNPIKDGVYRAHIRV